ncbi:LON peptidase substrate-binding domain-containing protein [Aquabacterium sp.]|uniref:LON peptidase substrate-binding domain-containing protein n=1 Tax=Aquabacterium sp. TaxID=1872578 RepID=UPI002BAE2006|nr:LON peptidase substrate-binding domain-containing protein [Aquabacterium sp.]HSW06254.1 LON peptidase substrate-binding domain-containing protein [Aquabacterium sp.]
MTDSASHLAGLPLFPLQTVLFPGGALSLKVFEARYLDLVSRCMRENSPFGVVCLNQGSEVRSTGGERVRFEAVGVLARLQDVDAEQTGILRVRCLGAQRFRVGPPRQQDDGLWFAGVDLIDADATVAPPAELAPTVVALTNAIESLRTQGHLPFIEPFQMDDAGWVANRWCEILPISLAAKQKLMELEEPTLRLKLVDEFLRGKGVVQGN